MLTRRQKIIIFTSIIVGLVIVLISLYFLFFKAKPEVPEDIILPDGAVDTSTTGISTTPTVPTIVPLTAEQKEELYARQTARTFVERFNSYSNQNGNSHITDVLSLATDEMAQWLNNQVLDGSNDYFGVTTVVVASRVESIASLSASVGVDVQQVTTDKTGEHTLQRSGRVDLLKINNIWKVDGWFWE